MEGSGKVREVHRGFCAISFYVPLLVYDFLQRPAFIGTYT